MPRLTGKQAVCTTPPARICRHSDAISLANGGVGHRCEAVHALIGAGLEGKGDYAAAAQAYQQAAEQAAFALERQTHQADAARAMTLAGNAQGAVAIWQELANDPTSPFSAEARVRLGELQAAPAGQS